MSLFKRRRARREFAKRLAAFGRARKQGMSVGEAWAYVDRTYPSSPEVLEYEEYEYERQLRKRDSGQDRI